MIPIQGRAGVRDDARMPRKTEPVQESAEERDARIRADLRREAHARAHDASPLQAGSDLAEENPERAAAREEAEKG